MSISSWGALKLESVEFHLKQMILTLYTITVSTVQPCKYKLYLNELENNTKCAQRCTQIFLKFERNACTQSSIVLSTNMICNSVYMQKWD